MTQATKICEQTNIKMNEFTIQLWYFGNLSKLQSVDLTPSINL